MPSIPYIGELTPNVIAALVGAGITLVAALINLRIAWRREVIDRLNRSRSTPRGRRGLLIAITFLVLAAGVGGYATALYLMQTDQTQMRAMRFELRQRIAEIKDTAERLEQSRVGELATFEVEARLREERRRGGDGVTSTGRIAACRAGAASPTGAASPGAATGPAPCSESEAVPVGVCVAIPVTATVYEVTPFARFDGDDSPWADRRAALGARLGSARFAAQPVERPDSDTTKNVCLDVWSWDPRALDARVRVKYLLPERSGADSASGSGAPIRAAASTHP